MRINPYDCDATVNVESPSYGLRCKTLIARLLRPWKWHLDVSSIPKPNSWSGRFVNHVASFKVVETLDVVHGIVALLVLTTHLVWGTYWFLGTFIFDLDKPYFMVLYAWSKVCFHSHFIHWLHVLMVHLIQVLLHSHFIHYFPGVSRFILWFKVPFF